MEVKMKILVINGPNLNFLGIREKAVYGTQNYEYLLSLLQKKGEETGCEVETFQSNHEGAIIDRIQEAYFDGTDGIVINPAAYTHTSIGILDALKAVSIPAVEVHISAVDEREDFRQVSYAGMACFARVAGEGLAGYRHALQLLADHLK